MKLYQTRLDLGAGTHPADGFEGVDTCIGATHRVNLTDGHRWPWPDNSVSELFSSHFIEHIQADYIKVWASAEYKDALLWFFDEAYRIIVPDGKFTVIWPALQSTEAFRDPTHRRFIPLEMTHYLSRKGRETMRVTQYNCICDWEVVDVQLRLNPGEWTQREVSTLWTAQNSYQVTMLARK